MATVVHNTTFINSSLETVVNQAAIRHDARLTEAIVSEVYGWPGQTVRFDGSIAGTTRNIVDTGDFANSQTLNVQGLQAFWVWDAPHAVYARFGFTSQSGNTFPERPFEQYADQIEPLLQILAEESRGLFS